MSGEKRAASQSFGNTQLVKRQRSEANLNEGALVQTNGNPLIQHGTSTAGLQAPVMELCGHTGEVFCARFDPSGTHIASGSMDRTIMLWRSSGDCDNYGVLAGHKSAVLDVQWSRDGQTVYSAGAADLQIASWDAETGARQRRHAGHTEVVNCLDTSRRGDELLVSGSDDSSVGTWDTRQKAATGFLETPFPVTAVCLAPAGNELFSAGIDGGITAWDMRARKAIYTLSGHVDTVTSLALSPESLALLSFSHDGTARTWDARPYAAGDRATRVFDGAQVGLEKNLIGACWDSTGKRIAAGGGDGMVTIWDTDSGRILHKLAGHRGTVNDVRISPNDAMVLSASTDRMMLLGDFPREAAVPAGVAPR